MMIIKPLKQSQCCCWWERCSANIESFCPRWLFIADQIRQINQLAEAAEHLRCWQFSIFSPSSLCWQYQSYFYIETPCPSVRSSHFLQPSYANAPAIYSIYEVDNDKVDNDNVDNDKVNKDKGDKDKVDKDKVDKDKVYKDKVDKDKVDRDKVDRDKVDRDNVDKDKDGQGQGGVSSSISRTFLELRSS